MNEAYFEIMIKKQCKPQMKIFTLAARILGCCFLFLGLLGILLAFLPGIFCLILSYFLNLYQTVEFEYLYVDKELQIDRILGRTKRKRLETLDLLQLEILAPGNSHELDRYHSRKMEMRDYTSGSSKDGKGYYTLVINGRMIHLEPTQDLVKTIQMISPRKVFTY